MENNLKPRLWVSEDPQCNTAVMYCPDPVKVVMGTNIGWCPLGNTPEDPEEAEKFAIKIASNYNLIEDERFADEIEKEEEE